MYLSFSNAIDAQQVEQIPVITQSQVIFQYTIV